MDYFITMITSVFENIWFSNNGINLTQLYLLSALGLTFAGIFQNASSIISDKVNRRFPFLIIAHVSQTIGMLIAVWIPNFLTFILYTFLMEWVSNETYRVVVGYHLIELCRDPQKDPKLHNPTKEFSKYRVFGSIGFAIAGPIVGYSINAINIIAQLSPTDGALGYQMLYSIMAILNIFYISYLTWFMRDYIALEKSFVPKHKKNVKEAFSEHPVKNLFQSRDFTVIIISQTIFWGCNAIGLAVIEIFMKNLGATVIFIGWRPFIWAMSELPLFFLSSSLAKRYSYITILFLSYQFLTIKLIVYYFLMTPELIWLDLALQFFNSFGMSYPVVTNAFNTLLPKQSSLANSVFNTFKNLSALVGALIGVYISSLMSSDLQAFEILFVIALIFNIFNSGLLFLLRNWSKHEIRSKNQLTPNL